jgi:hypothetical protein
VNNNAFGLILIISLVLSVIGNNVCNFNQIIYAQTKKTETLERNSITNVYPNFSAVGRISSLNFDNNSVLDIAAAKKVVLSGDWSVNVNNGSISFFEADFIAAPSDGSVSHTHQLVNLIGEGGLPIQILSNGNASIVGTIDVKLNGISLWNAVKTTILISKGSTITIILSDLDTRHHFMKQPIYGIVDRLMY